jgi:hypothetical protein
LIAGAFFVKQRGHSVRVCRGGIDFHGISMGAFNQADVERTNYAGGEPLALGDILSDLRNIESVPICEADKC